MEGVKAETDIAAFIQSNRSNGGKLFPEAPPPVNTFLNVSIVRVINKGFDAKLEMLEVDIC